MQGQMDVGNDHLSRIMSALDRNIVERFSRLHMYEEKISVTRKYISSTEGLLGENYGAKCLELAEGYRLKGNDLYKKGNFLDALEQYTRSVCYTPTGETGDTKNLALAYANRSAVLLHLNRYNLALVDIDRAFNSGYPSDLEHKLLERKIKCLVGLGHCSKAQKTLRALHLALENVGKSNKRLLAFLQNEIKVASQTVNGMTSDTSKSRTEPPHPFTETQFKISTNEHKGRHVIATEKIEVGGEIVEEKPYASCLFNSYANYFCFHCFQKILAPVACPQCSLSRFCSETCRDDSWRQYHGVECKYMNHFSSASGPFRYAHLALRALLATEDGALQLALSSFQATSNCKEDSLIDFMNHSTSILHLTTHSEKRQPDEALTFAVMACLLLQILEAESFFSEQKTCLVRSADSHLVEKHKTLIGSLLFKHMEIIACNAYEICAMVTPDCFAQCTPTDVGFGLYSILSIFNHSCNPNADINFYGNRGILQAISPIQPGQEICIDYGWLYFLHGRSARQASLASQYFFICTCEACANHWPMEQQMTSVIPVLKCENCRQPLPPSTKIDVQICEKCCHHSNIPLILALLNKMHNSYVQVMKNLVNGKDIDSSLEVLEKYLTLMDSVVCEPWRDFIRCQAAIKQCYRMKANICH